MQEIHEALNIHDTLDVFGTGITSVQPPSGDVHSGPTYPLPKTHKSVTWL